MKVIGLPVAIFNIKNVGHQGHRHITSGDGIVKDAAAIRIVLF
jgi:hypothetical protein